MSDTIVHPFPPFYDEYSRILILGSFPSVRSREDGFYYAHPQNRFWKILERLFSVELRELEDKKEFLHSAHIALWDSIASCTIIGSSDSAIGNVSANDIKGLLDRTRITRIFTNGSKAHDVYMEYCLEDTGIVPIKLPSTSPANAAYSIDRLIESWEIVKHSLADQ